MINLDFVFLICLLFPITSAMAIKLMDLSQTFSRRLSTFTLAVVFVSSLIIPTFESSSPHLSLFFLSPFTTYLPACISFSLLISSMLLPSNQECKRGMRYILFVCAIDIGILSIDSVWGLPVIGLLSVIATYKFAFNSKIYLWSHLTAILVLGSGIFLLDGLTTDLLFSKKLEWNFLSLETTDWKVQASLIAISFAVVFHQLYFLVRSLWTKNGNISFLIIALLTTINFGLVVAVKLLFPIAALYKSQYIDLINIAAVAALLFFSVLALFASSPRQLLVRLMAIQSTIVLLGFVQFNGMGESGAIVQWVVSLLGGTGFGLCILMFENRVGINEFHVSSVAFDKMPRIAFLYFFFGLAMVDFPGTLGFVGEDLLVHAVLSKSVVSGFVILLTMACASIAIYRSFTILFLGKKLRPNEHRVDLVKREAMGIAFLVGSLVSFSFFPGVVFPKNISQDSPDIGQTRNLFHKPKLATQVKSTTDFHRKIAN